MKVRYRALGPDGKSISGQAEHPSLDAAVSALRASGLLPVEVMPASSSSRLMAILNTEITPSRGLPAKDRIAMTEALGTLLEAGLPLDKALSVASEFASTRAAKRIAESLHTRVTGGASLYEAAEVESRNFPPYWLGVVRAGETSAQLGPVLTRLATSEADRERRRAALVSALIYPAFLVVTAMISVGILLVVVVPSFEPMLASAGAELPALTRAVMAAGNITAALWPFALGIVLAGALLGRLALARPTLRAAWHRILLRLPVVGPLRRRLASAAVARLLAELLNGGVALPKALQLTEGALSDAAFQAELARLRPQVEAGNPLAQVLQEGGIMDNLAIRLADVGARSGKLPAMLERAATILQDEATTTLNRLLSLVTPIVTLVMGGLVAVIVSSILFALFTINDLTGI